MFLNVRDWTETVSASRFCFITNNDFDFPEFGMCCSRIDHKPKREPFNVIIDILNSTSAARSPFLTFLPPNHEHETYSSEPTIDGTK